MHQNKQTTHEKQNLSKTEQSEKSVTNANLWNSKNPTKIGRTGKFVY